MTLLIRTAILLVLATIAGAEEPPAPLHGRWSATVGSQVLRGTWSAEPVRDTSNTARGGWQLLNDASQIVVDGTWAAQKTAGVWQGTWSARVRSGQVFSGTWQTALKESASGTLGEMLQRTLQGQVTGSWRSQGMSGTWSLRATAK
jgi:hypothetical protein